MTFKEALDFIRKNYGGTCFINVKMSDYGHCSPREIIIEYRVVVFNLVVEGECESFMSDTLDGAIDALISKFPLSQPAPRRLSKMEIIAEDISHVRELRDENYPSVEPMISPDDESDRRTTQERPDRFEQI